MKLKACSLKKKISEIDKPLARLIKKKRDFSNKMRKEKREVTTNTTEI